MATFSEIKDALDNTIEKRIPGLKAYGDVSDVVQPPAVVVMPARRTADFTGAMARGMDTWRFDLYVLVARGEVTTAQNALDEYLTGSGEKSIREVLWKNADLGLTDGTDAMVEGIRNYGGKFVTARNEHIGAIVEVVVRTPGR